MKTAILQVLALGTMMALAVPAAAKEPVSYSRDVKLFLARYCLECHSADKAKGGLEMQTFQALMKGGKTGPVVTAGDPDDSRLVLLAEGKEKPAMPPETAKQPKPAEVAVLRAWVAAGAKDDSATYVPVVPDVKPRVPTVAPLAAVAYHPAGKLLAAGGHGEVLLLETAKAEVVGKLPGQTSRVTAVAFSRDGRRLAVASGSAGKSGEIRLYKVADGRPAPQPEQVVEAHKDMIYDLAFSPDGKLLASCGYDRLVKLWDAATGKEVHALKDHSDAVYGVSFSPDGKLLASAGADRAVKVWDVADGTRLYTLGEAADWVYAVAWGPKGGHLAAAGVDKSIRVWEATREGGKLVHSVFAHEGPVTRLAYGADGQLLYSLGEDRTAKAWDTERMVERRVYPRQKDLPLALAVRPDHKQLALGRFDGALVLLDEATGKVQAEAVPAKPKPPQVNKVIPAAATRGQTLRLTLEGKDLEAAAEVTVAVPGATAQVVSGSVSSTKVEIELTLPPTAAAGTYPVTVKTPAGQSAPVNLIVDLFRPVSEGDLTGTPQAGRKITLPVTLVGSVGRAGEADSFRFEAKAGEEVGVQAMTAAVGSKLEPHLQLTDDAGQVLAEGTNGVLGHTCARAGTYVLSIRDRDYRGGADMPYRLHVGDVPVVTGVFPLGLQRGTEAEVRVEGVNLGGVKSVHVKAPADATPGTKLPLPVQSPRGTVLGGPAVVVGEFPEAVFDAKQSGPLPVPGTVNGRVGEAGATVSHRFQAKKGERLIVEVNARRLGSPLDSTIEVLDAKGQPVPRATLRCLAKTHTTFRDHDSASPGIRIESWNELAVNDYLYVGGELLRIEALPKNPDDDCRFFSVAGQRTGFLDTTPTFHSNGTPMYKVAVHPPGSTFAPNGLPVITLPYRNDDGGPGYGKDSRLFFDPPADGEYLVRVTDARGQGGASYAYRLTVRPPRPSFNVTFTPTSPAVWKGGALPVSVTAERIDGFDGAIEVRLANLPPGFQAPVTTIPEGENGTTFALFAEPAAAPPAKGEPLTLVARAHVGGREVVREVAGGAVTAVEPGDLVTTTEQAAVTVRPGQEVRLTVRIERRNGFAGRVPLDVRGLPHGVRVLDIGLNGILITEKETVRTFVIYAEPWVRPTEHPFVVLARREGKNTEHAAKSVLLKVAGK